MAAKKSEAATSPADRLVITVSRCFAAPAEVVFDAWLDATAIGEWLFATPGGKMVHVEIAPRAGGKFVVFEQRGELIAEHYGRYLEIDRPRRIVFLFAVTKLDDAGDEASRVAIDIAPIGNGCELILTHEIHPKWAEYVDRTRGGWTEILEKLHIMIESKASSIQVEPVVIERVLDAPVESVWQAITHKEGFKHWCFDVDDFHPEVGFEFHFAGEDQGVTFMHNCRVMEVVPLKKLAYSWRYEGFEGDSLVTWELFPEGQSTRVKLTHAGLETFPKHPSFIRDNFQKGWTEIIGTLLKSFLEKQQTSQ